MKPSGAVRRIGRYSVFQPISQGGTATVHYGLMHHESGDPEPVAIKRLLPGLTTDPHFPTMLVDEARIAGHIKHANVVQIVDVIDDEGEPLIVFEYVHGTSLSHVARLIAAVKSRMPANVAAAIAVDALRGLHAAHEAKDEIGRPLEIVHRDVSPQNILLDVAGVARVTDFGIAKARGRLQRTTETGSLKGKLGYLAPEQIHGQVTRRSDLFSMGTVLWEMLVGERLFQGDSEGEVLGKTLSGPIPAPTRRGATCTRELELVVMKALEREPELRFETASDMADAVAASTTIATAIEVATWLDGIAHEVIASRDEVIRTLPNHAIEDATIPVSVAAPEGAPARRKWVVPSVVTVAFVSAFGIALAIGRASKSEPLVTSATSASASVSAPESESARPEAPPVATTAAPMLSSEPANAGASAAPNAPEKAPEKAPPSKAPVRSPAPKRPDCKVPYVVDATGHKVWRRECFGKTAR